MPANQSETTRKWYLPVEPRRTPVVLGRTTQDFFLRGEEQEASNYENVPFDDAVLDPPKVEFDSFDKIPRKRHPLVVLMGLVSIAAVGVLAWRSFGSQLAESSWVRVATRAMVRSDTVTRAAPAPAPVAHAPSVPIPAAKVVAAPAPAEAPAEPPAEAPAEAASPPPPPAADVDPPPPVEDEVREPAVRPAPAPRHRARPLRGYVWSPAERALVPAERAAPQPDSAAIDRANPQADRPLPLTPEAPGSDPPVTSPPPFQTGKSPNAAPIIE